MKLKSILLGVALSGALCFVGRANDVFTIGQPTLDTPLNNILIDAPAMTVLTVQNTLNNADNFDWPAYQVAVSMSQVFTIGMPMVLNQGWTATITQQPILSGGVYSGIINYMGGTPVTPGQILSFSYQLSFTGAASYTQTLTPVPEPGPLGLLALGMFCSLILLRARQQRTLC